jgi:DNA-binding CsgD family transcriptional regulator
MPKVLPQIKASGATKVMSHIGSEGVFVMLCDWRGQCIWVSTGDVPVTVGELIWQNLVAESQEQTKLVLGLVVTGREAQQLEFTDNHGHRFLGWFWPLDSPEVAACVLGMRVPRELELLTDRERECLELFALGMETRRIAQELDVSISTIHTHMKRAREKLSLPSVEALISFAARYAYPVGKSFPQNAL